MHKDMCHVCWEDALEKPTKSKLVSWHYNENHVADASDEKILSRNNNKELCEELDSPLKLSNVYQNLAIYNIKYIELPKIKNFENKLTI